MAIFNRTPPEPAPQVDPEAVAQKTQSEDRPRIGDREIAEAQAILERYRQGKANLERRVKEDEQWYKLRHWEVLRGKKTASPEPSSAWLFNAILNKHADAMDNYPEPMVLPRERSDEESAKALSSVLPCILEYNDFEAVYSAAWWDKLKHGTSCYSVTWNNEKENGLGDVDITSIDLLRIYWEPGISDIQRSKNLFIVDLQDEDALKAQYPQYADKLHGGAIDVAQYVHDDYVDTSDKLVVVDWYYKTRTPDGRTLLQFCKFCNGCLLYASENDPQYRDTGWYDHGEYPVVLDVLFPEAGTPVGFGYVAICKDPQLYIDKLSANILESSLIGTKTRYFVSKSTNINREQMLDISEPLVEVEGEISDARIRQITTDAPSALYYNVMQGKIEEMKDTSANRDVNSGGVGSGVTSGAAISALQEAGNKASRDMIAASYRTYVKLNRQIIELFRQFYTEERSFRITGDQPGQYEFQQFSNAGMQDQEIGLDVQTGAPLFRHPVFDLKISAQRKNPFSRMEQNQRAQELYAAGFFAPDNAQAAIGALSMMDFEGIEKVREYVQQGQTLLAICQQLQQQNLQLQAALGAQLGTPMATGASDQSAAAAGGNGGSGSTSARRMDGIMSAQSPKPAYAQQLAERARA